MSPKTCIAIIHYHLRPGGVTRVISNAISAMPSDQYDIAVITGEPPAHEQDWSVPLKFVDGLNYSDTADLQPSKLAERLEQAAREAFQRPPDIWHVHNHSLGKNMIFPAALRRLAEKGQRLLLQIHDFAEDRRPANYRLLLDKAAGGDIERLGQLLYPQASHVHYAALNQRDFSFLARTGLPGDELHLLPNAISLKASFDELPDVAREGRLFLYPVRAIRRKNLGEFLLWSARGARGDRFAVTLPPKNPKEKPLYQRWVALANELRLPMEFEASSGRDVDFIQLLRDAHVLVSTSIQEGFGMSFLEPWLVPRPLAGRKLADITAAIEADGVDLNALYPRLDVLLEWIGAERLRTALSEGLKTYLEAYRRVPTDEDVARAYAAAVHQDRVDFSRLDETMQREVIARVADSPQQAGGELDPNALELETDPLIIRRNAEAVKRQYNLERYGERLRDLYDHVLESPTGKIGAVSAQSLLDQYLAPERFHLLLQ